MILKEFLEVCSVETQIMLLDITSGQMQIIVRGLLHYVEIDLKANNEQVLFMDVVFVRYEWGTVKIELRKGSWKLGTGDER